MYRPLRFAAFRLRFLQRRSDAIKFDDLLSPEKEPRDADRRRTERPLRGFPEAVKRHPPEEARLPDDSVLIVQDVPMLSLLAEPSPDECDRDQQPVAPADGQSEECADGDV